MQNIIEFDGQETAGWSAEHISAMVKVTQSEHVVCVYQASV